MVEIKSPTRGLIGYLHGIEYNEENSLLVFQLPRKTEHLNPDYLAHASDTLLKALPKGRKAILIGCDVNVYELAGADAIILKLKGLI